MCNGDVPISKAALSDLRKLKKVQTFRSEFESEAAIKSFVSGRKKNFNSRLTALSNFASVLPQLVMILFDKNAI